VLSQSVQEDCDQRLLQLMMTMMKLMMMGKQQMLKNEQRTEYFAFARQENG